MHRAHKAGSKVSVKYAIDECIAEAAQCSAQIDKCLKRPIAPVTKLVTTRHRYSNVAISFIKATQSEVDVMWCPTYDESDDKRREECE